MGPTCHSLSLFFYLPPVPSLLVVVLSRSRSAPAPDRPRPHSSTVASRWRPWRSPHRSSPPIAVLARSPPRTSGASHSSTAASRWQPRRCCRGAPPDGRAQTRPRTCSTRLVSGSSGSGAKAAANRPRCGSSGSGALAPSLLAQVGRDASFSRRRIRGDPSLAGARRPPPHPCHAPASLAARASLQLGECGE
jgi:hypothetical protein